MSTATQLLTAQDLWNLPGDGLRHELVRGELRTMPPSGGEHGVVGMNLAAPLATHVRANQVGVVLNAEAGFILSRNPDTVRGADIAFVQKDRIPASGIPTAFWPGAPDLAVEVVSPGDTVNEVEGKVQEWLEAGTRLVWVVNPRRRTVTVYDSPRSAAILGPDEELDGAAVVPGFHIRVGSIFV